MKVIIRRQTVHAVEAAVIDSTGKHHTISLVVGRPDFCTCHQPGCQHLTALHIHLGRQGGGP